MSDDELDDALDAVEEGDKFEVEFRVGMRYGGGHTPYYTIEVETFAAPNPVAWSYSSRRSGSTPTKTGEGRRQPTTQRRTSTASQSTQATLESNESSG